jgi:hypothetical protein
MFTPPAGARARLDDDADDDDDDDDDELRELLLDPPLRPLRPLRPLLLPPLLGMNCPPP